MAWEDESFHSWGPDHTKGMHILLVDLDTSYMLDTTSMLQAASYKVTPIGQQEVALAVISERGEQFGAIIAAFEAQDGNSATFLSQIRNIKDDIPIFVMLPDSPPQETMSTPSNEPCFILHKPITDYDLQNLSKNMIEIRKLIALNKAKRAANKESTNQEKESDLRKTQDNFAKQSSPQKKILGTNNQDLRAESKIKRKDASCTSNDHLNQDLKGKNKHVLEQAQKSIGEPPEKKRKRDGNYLNEKEGRPGKRDKIDIDKSEIIIKPAQDGRKRRHNKSKQRLWNPELYKKFMDAIRRPENKEVNDRRVHEASNEPTLAPNQVAGDIQDSRHHEQKQSVAKEGSKYDRNNISISKELHTKKEINQYQLQRTPQTEPPTAHTEHLVPTTMTSFHGKLANMPNPSSQRQRGCFQGPADVLQSPQHQIDRPKIQKGDEHGLNNYRLGIPSNGKHKGSLPLFGNTYVPSCFNFAADVNPRIHANQPEKYLASPIVGIHRTGSDVRHMTYATCNPNIYTGQQAPGIRNTEWFGWIKQGEEPYSNSGLSQFQMSHMEFSEFRGQLISNVLDARYRATSKRLVPLTADHRLGHVASGMANSNMGSNSYGATRVSCEDHNLLMQSILAPNSHFFMEGDTLSTQDIWNSGQLTELHPQLVNLGQTSPFESVYMDQLSAQLHGNQSLTTLEVHGSTSIPSTHAVSNNWFVETREIPAIFPPDLDGWSTPASESNSHINNEGLTSITLPDMNATTSHENLNNLTSQLDMTNMNIQTGRLKTCQKEERCEKLDEFNPGDFFTELQDEATFWDENFGLNTDNLVAILPGSR
ncbi:hypothetical protein Droror1_Dr00022693 [Drosera rotundifolia]